MSSRAMRQIDPRVQIIGALLAARAGGCNCSPQITIRQMATGAHYAEVAHDRWCSHPSQRRGQDP